jgi:hypothetical protein
MNESKKRIQISKYPPIDVNDDILMVKLGLRQPKNIPIIRNKLTAQEREKLKVLKSSTQPLVKTEKVKIPKPSLNKIRLTVYFINVKKEPNFKTTITTYIYREDVEDFLQSKVNERLKLGKIFLDTKLFKFIPRPKNF